MVPDDRRDAPVRPFFRSRIGEHSFGTDHQCPLRERVENVERAEDPPVMRPILDDVIGPEVIGSLRPQPDTGAVI